MKNPLKGMANLCSIILLVLMLAFLGIGIGELYEGDNWGWLTLTIGTSILISFRKLSPAPREVGVLTVLGVRTNIMVEGITLVWDPFGIEIVGLQRFVIKQYTKEFPVDSARCSDGVRVRGKAAISFFPDCSSASTLWQYYDAGESEGVFEQIDEIVVVGIQEIVDGADDGVGRTYRWVETHPTKIAAELLVRIRSHRPISDSDELDDTRGLGIRIKKLQAPLTPINAEVIKADEDKVVELLQREAELRDTETVNKQAMSRKKMYEDQGLTDVNIKACREEIMFERLSKDKKVNIVQGGRLVNLGTVGNTDKG